MLQSSLLCQPVVKEGEAVPISLISTLNSILSGRFGRVFITTSGEQGKGQPLPRSSTLLVYACCIIPGCVAITTDYIKVILWWFK